MSRLLLVEDDEPMGETLCERLELEGYEVVWAQNQKSAEKKLVEFKFDLVILDVGLPDGSGFELARIVRKSSSVPFIFVTAMNTAEHRLEGYEIGAEEYIPKPFHLKELLIRIQHVLKNHGVKQEIRVGDRMIDFDARAIVGEGGEPEFLATRDFQLLKLLIESTPKVLSRDEILDRVWGEDQYPSHRTVDNAIVRLRQALGPQGGKSIRSVRGVGYQWLESGDL